MPGKPLHHEVIIASPSRPDDAVLLRDLRKGDVFLPARWVLGDYVSRALAVAVSPALIWNPKQKREVLQDMPRSLLGAIYLQFAQAVFSDTPVQQCRCGRWFACAQKSSRKTRPDREVCSNSCRTAAYSDNRKDAQQMHADGKSVKEIAKSLGCKRESVEKWVAHLKE
jgi:hypothetical protein